jgi:hypothetical protein
MTPEPGTPIAHRQRSRDNPPVSDDSMSGGIERAGPGRVEGWCWCAARPDAQLTVEILLDDETVATVVAGSFRPDLARAGKGDGRHAFVFDFPDRPDLNRFHLDQAGVIGLREASTGQIVGRIRQLRADETQVEDARLERLREAVAPILAAASSPLPRPASVRLREICNALGDRLAARADAPDADMIAVALQSLARTLDPLALPLVGAPDVSMVLRATDATLAHGRIAALAPSLGAMRTELLVGDDGTDPRIAMLPTIIANLPLLRSEPGFAALGNAAAAVARGRRLVLLDLAGEPASPPAGLADPFAGGERPVVAGPSVLAAAARFGVPHLLGAERIAGGDTAFRIGVALDAFHDLGGLDPMLGDDSDVCSLDFCLKAVLSGRPVVALTAEWPRGAMARPPARRGAEMAAARFRRRWK